ncbi:MAG: PorV/PorQ family protein [Chlorobi bacterium]|nr:PorV/PorQ family protein [Chlorobiota bacterium]
MKKQSKFRSGIFLVLFAFAIAFGGNIVFAQGTTALPFLLISPDARANGMGETGSAIADKSTAIFWNPGGLAFQTGTDVSFTYSDWLPDLPQDFPFNPGYTYSTFKMNIPEIEGTLSASLFYFGYGINQESDADDSRDYALTLGYARKLGSDWGLGLNLRYVNSRLVNTDASGISKSYTATSFNFDLGVLWRPVKFLDGKFSAGMSVSNMGGEIYYVDEAQSDPIPTNLRFGFAYEIFKENKHSLLAAVDFSRLLVQRPDSTGERDSWYKAIFSSWGNDKAFNEFIFSTGIEYQYGRPDDVMFSLRSGFFYEDPNNGDRKYLTFGAGWRYKYVGLDLSYLWTSLFEGHENSFLDNTWRVQLSVGWGAEKQNTLGLPRGI